MTCVYEEPCEEKPYTRGLCRKHYSRAHSQGRLEEVALPRKHGAVWHKLTNKCEETQTADCVVCGPNVPIEFRKTQKTWRCVRKNQGRSRKYVFGADGDQKIPISFANKVRQELSEIQNGLCAICLSAPATSLDHCHTTGRIRGLLCAPCNVGLGFFDDSVEKLKAATDYLSL